MNCWCTTAKWWNPTLLQRSRLSVPKVFLDCSKQQSDGKREQARQFLIRAITDLDVEGLVIINFGNQYFMDTIIVCLLLKHIFLMNPSSLSHARASCSPCPQVCSLSGTLHHSTNINRYWGFTVFWFQLSCPRLWTSTDLFFNNKCSDSMNSWASGCCSVFGLL